MNFSTGLSGKLVLVVVFVRNWLEVTCRKVFALIPRLVVFLLRSLEKISYNSGGKYECVFLTDPEVKQTIEVKSELTNSLLSLRTVISDLRFKIQTKLKRIAGVGQ